MPGQAWGPPSNTWRTWQGSRSSFGGYNGTAYCGAAVWYHRRREAGRPAGHRHRARHPGGCFGDGGERALVRVRRAGAHLPRSRRRAGQRDSLPRRRSAPGDCPAGAAVELRRRRGIVSAGVRGAAHPPRAPVRLHAGGAHLAGGAAAASDHRGVRGDAAAAARCASCWPTIPAPARRS